MPKPKTLFSWTAAVEFIRSEILSGKVRHLSVDVFDTLLIRTTTPESVIAATARFVGGRIGVPAERVLAARDDAWVKETAEAVRAGKDPDAESKSLFKRWIGSLASDVDVEPSIEAALSFELSSEAACLAPNAEMLSILQFAKARGIEVTALSDMYLSPAEVSALLSAHGMKGLVGRVITSGHLGLQKRTGRLFDWYVESMGGSDGLLHVGDDPVADGTMPASRGLVAVSVFDRRRMLARQRLSASRIDPAREAALSALQSHTPRSVAHDVGFSRFGPIYTGFIHGVVERAANDGVSSVWFLAREGWMLHELYSSMRRSGLVADAPPSGYLYASRVATMRAQLEDFGDRQVGSVHSDTWSRKYRSTLSPLQLDDEDLNRIMGGAGISADDTVTDEGLRLLRSHSPFRDAVRNIGENERLGLKAYLERIGFPLEGKVALVDVGWGGQIQENFERALRLMGASTKVVGYYLGTDDRAERRRQDGGLIMHGIVVDKCNNDGSGLGAFSHVQGIELGTRAAHGSVKGYGADGMPRLAPESDRGRQAEAVDDPAISTMQEGILAFADGYLRAAAVLGARASQSVALARDVVDVASITPSRAEAEVVADMKNIANLGGDETLRLGASVSLRHPRHAIRVLRTTLWQEGTCATLMPGIGPLMFLALRRFKRRLPTRAGSIQKPVGETQAATVFDSVVEDVLALDLTTRRTALAAAYRSGTMDRGIGIAGLGDAVKLLAVRIAHGAPRGHAVSSIRTEAKALVKYLLSHPSASLARRLAKRLR